MSRSRIPVLLALVLLVSAPRSGRGETPYPVVDTGQTACYDTAVPIACPAAGKPFHGQDAQHAGRAAAYTTSPDGLTARDEGTGLTWQRSPDTNGDGALTAADKLTYPQALARPASLNASRFGGFTDWRLPTIRELYSLIDFRGTDPSSFTGTDTSGLKPFIDTTVFRFAYGSAPERIIDSQYASSTLYAAGGTKLFGVNFADGRIKGYDLAMPDGSTKTFFVQCVRGNPEYGKNRFTDSGDGTVLDSATGLVWTRADSGAAMTWQEALAWADARSAAGFLGHTDWRLPDAKELQSILDYSRSPDTTASAAIDPVFSVTPIVNEGGAADFPWYWASTTHASDDGMGASGVYLCFGRCGGWNKVPPSASCFSWVDVHGAGGQRGDPKTPSGRAVIGTACGGGTAWGRGPQGDVQRGANFVRLVRDGAATGAAATRFLPIVLDVTGRARYTSELNLVNRGTTAAAVTLAYTAATAFGGQGSGTATLELGAGRQLVEGDAIAFLRSKGLAIPAGNQGGTLRVTFEGLSTASAAHAGVRTTAPSESGRAGVAYEGAALEELPTTATTRLYGLRSTGDDRTNVAFANASTTGTTTLRLTLVDGDGSGRTAVKPDVTLGPGQWAQLDDVLAGTGFSQAYATVEVVAGSGPYQAYAVVNDQGTNDGSWVAAAAVEAAAGPLLVPVVVETGPYATELVLANPSASGRTVALAYVESQSPATGAGGSTTVTLAPGEQRVVPSIVDALRAGGAAAIGPAGGSYAGTLTVRFLAGGAGASGAAAARTGSAARTMSGRYGLAYPGLAAAAQASAAAWVHGLRQDAGVRANLAVAASGENPGPIAVRADVHDGGTGKLAGTTETVSLAPGGWMQWSGILARYGVAQGYARVVVASGTGSFAAYGVVNDGPAPGSETGTDDGSFLAGVPALVGD